MLEHLWPVLLAVLLEEVRVEGDAAADFGLCCCTVLVAYLQDTRRLDGNNDTDITWKEDARE